MSDSGPILPRRERLRRERKERILDAAAAVFAQKGFHQATIREIAALADVADGTIYNYFDTKSDLLIGIMTRLAELEQLPNELTASLQRGDAREFLVATFRHRLNRLDQGEEMLRAVLPEMLVNPELRERFYRQYTRRISTLLEQYLQAQIELGRIRPVNVPLTVRMVQGIFVGLLVLRVLGDPEIQAEWAEVPEALASLIFDGLNVRRAG